MAGREDEAIAVQPFWLRWAIVERMAEEYCADICSAERQAKVARIAGVDGIHGEATGFIGSLSEQLCVHYKSKICERWKCRRAVEVTRKHGNDKRQ